MIVASNRWRFELRQLPHADAQWLIDNSVYVPVTGPLWEEPLAHPCCSSSDGITATPSILGSS